MTAFDEYSVKNILAIVKTLLHIQNNVFYLKNTFLRDNI
ncbi:MAG: hypothetical protein ACJAZP_002146 [Psychromonas sp.]|jgi:hypothetical protein